MRFGPVPLDQAEGAILAHSVMAGSKIAKGTVLTADHLAALAAAGVNEVTVARLDPGDLHEDQAAADLAQAVCGDGLRMTTAKTGRVNLHATGPGIVQVDATRVDALNAVDPMLTLATVRPYQRLGAGGMAATIKVISYGVAAAQVARAAELGAGALRLLPPVFSSATLIETQVGAAPPDKGRRAMAGRLSAFDVALSDRLIVAHDELALSQALIDARGEVLLILTASATSDSHDTAPAALRRAGGTVIHYGMPVDPGNLLFLGRLGDKPVIGLPGCARSPALNGADWVLERVLCGVDVTGADIAGMGVGGLLKEIPQRGQLRDAD